MQNRTWAGLLLVGAAVGLGLGGVAAILATSAPVRPVAPLEIREGTVLSVNPDSVRGIDHALVHEVLVPDWVGAHGGIKALYWERLRRAVDGDPNLAALLERTDALIHAGPSEHVEELRAVVGAWNDVVASAGVDYRLAGELGASGDWWLKSYLEVLGDAEVVVDGAVHGVTVRRRLDGVAPADAWLGQLQGPDRRVVVLLDRVTSFTLDRIWPLLDPVLDGELDPLARRFAPAVRAEVARQLTPEGFHALQATAEDRYWLLRATAAIHARAECGSTFRIEGLPWNGLAAMERAALHARAREAGAADCPEVNQREALAFDVRSRHVRGQPGVRAALEELVAFVAEVVVVHEARHAADIAARDERGQPLACSGCPETLSPIGVWEGSAYLATFATRDSAALALFQACDIDPMGQPERAEVVSFLARALVEGGCEGTVPADLPAKARALEAEAYGRRSTVEIRGFPASLPVSSVYGSR